MSELLTIAATAWWTPGGAAWIGAVGGTSVGLLGAAFGVLAGTGARRGRFKTPVFAIGFGLIAVGLAALIAGVVAVAGGQPQHVWYPLVLLGGILTFVLGLNLPVIVGVYRRAERQKLEAGLVRGTPAS